MAAELRWILLALSAPLLIGIWWWGLRRTRRSPGNAHLREAGTGQTVMGPTIMGPGPVLGADDAESRDWGVPPFEPLSIRTAHFDQVQILDLPMSATADPLDVTLNMDYVEHETTDGAQLVPTAGAPAPAAPEPVTAAASAPAPDAAPAAATAAVAPPPSANTSETQRIITVRVCAVGDTLWPGAELLKALHNNGLSHGRYKVFHRRHCDGRTLFCAASLVEPGTFDIARMPGEDFRGVTLFAVLPGPADALETIDTLIATAAELAETLQGALQDSNGAPLSAARAEALREDVARFQQSLSMS